MNIDRLYIGSAAAFLTVMVVVGYVVNVWWSSPERGKLVGVRENYVYMEVPNFYPGARFSPYDGYDYLIWPELFVVRNNVPNTATITLARYEPWGWSNRLTTQDREHPQ